MNPAAVSRYPRVTAILSRLALTCCRVTWRRSPGLSSQPPETGIRLGPADTGEAWPRVVQYVVPDRVSEQLGYPVLDRVIRLGPEAPGALPRDWGEQPPVPFGPQRHVGYAVQWFALAATLLVIFVVVNWRRKGGARGSN